MPAFCNDFKWRMPFASLSVKARYLPRWAAGTVASDAEKSRMCSSYRAMSVGASSFGMRWSSQPAGFSCGLSRFAMKLRALFAERLSEYGSVTVFVTILLSAQRDNTCTVYV